MINTWNYILKVYKFILDFSGKKLNILKTGGPKRSFVVVHVGVQSCTKMFKIEQIMLKFTEWIKYVQNAENVPNKTKNVQSEKKYFVIQAHLLAFLRGKWILEWLRSAWFLQVFEIPALFSVHDTWKKRVRNYKLCKKCADPSPSNVFPSRSFLKSKGNQSLNMHNPMSIIMWLSFFVVTVYTSTSSPFLTICYDFFLLFNSDFKSRSWMKFMGIKKGPLFPLFMIFDGTPKAMWGSFS